MTQPPKCDISEFAKATEDHTKRDDFLITPEEMDAEVRAYQLFLDAARKPCAESVIDWEDWYRDALFEGGFDGRFAELAVDLLQRPDWTNETIGDYFIQVASEKTRRPPEEFDQATWDRLDEFLESPTAEVAQRTSIDEIVPNAVDVMCGIEAAWRHYYAQVVCRHREPPVVLRVTISPPEPGTSSALTGPSELWVWLAPDTNNIERSDPDIFLISASLVHLLPHGAGELAAVLRGQLIPTVKNGRFVHPNDLFEIMDAHTEMLNDVWKTIKGQFLPAVGLDELDQLAETFMDGEALGAAICVPWIFVGEKFRGHEVSILMLNTVAAASIDPQSVLYSGAMVRPSSDDDEGDDEHQSLLAMLQDNPIRLYILPIEGTKPTEVVIVNPLARGDLSKDARRKVVDRSVERRRISLNRYFNRDGDRYQGFYVHTYNPWDYPMT